MDGAGADVAAAVSDDGGKAEGRARVRLLLLARVEEAGLQRPKGQIADAHAAMLARLVDHCDHMTEANLRTLADLVLDHAAGPQRTVWPSEVLVRNLAQALQPRPAVQHRIVSSWLASVEGPVAEAGGWLVELYRFLVRHRRPPLVMDQRKLREEAADSARTRELVRSRIERGCASPEDLGWMERYASDEREAQRLVDQGRGKRGAV